MGSKKHQISNLGECLPNSHLDEENYQEHFKSVSQKPSDQSYLNVNNQSTSEVENGNDAACEQTTSEISTEITSAESEQVFCVCKKTNYINRSMVQCYRCLEWFYWDCIGVDITYVQVVTPFLCNA